MRMIKVFDSADYEPHLEETGYRLLPESINEYGKTLRILKGSGENEIFEQESFYYTCKVDERKQSASAPDDGYEVENSVDITRFDCIAGA